jgi:diguanylate cyclase (GGDEF)-like protein
MLHRIQRALSRTLARQMVFALTLFLSITLSLFSWEMMRRQQVRQARQQQEQVLALAASLAVSSGVWVSARDYSGLQEIVQGVAQFPEMRYAMVLDTQGLILAHLPAQRRGQYITDVPVAVAPRVLHMADHVTDITQPIRLGTSHVGWVRVGVGNGSFEAEFATDRRDVVLFTLLAIVLSTAVASLIARHQTRRLRHVERVARAVQQGQSPLRARVSGIDEAAQLAEHFNAMLDRIDDRERALRDSESLLRHSQELGKIGSWEWDVEKSSMQWTPETFRIHELPVQAELPQGQAAIDLSVACYAPLDRERVLKAFARCIQEGVPFDLECRFTTTRQRPLWIRTQGQAEVRDGKVVKVVGYIADITERKKMEEEIRNMAYFDPLTALPNRRMLIDRLQHAMAGGARSGHYGALIYLDLDNFKPLNDTHGHAAGDLLLVEVAQRLLGCVRQTDTVARTGGDEFVVVLNDLSADADTAAAECQRISAKILAALSAPYVLSLAHGASPAQVVEHRCSASVGATLFKGEALYWQDLMKKADAAMYQAKAAGRNRVQFDASLGL